MKSLNAITFTPSHYDTHIDGIRPAKWVGWCGGREWLFEDTREGVLARAEEEGIIVPKRVRNNG